jgi:Flp pilus assembly protein TadB
MWFGVALAGLLILTFVLWSQSPKARRARRARQRQTNLTRLRREYARLLHLPPTASTETVNRVLREMARDYPDRSAEWHLRKLISDLQRDRR